MSETSLDILAYIVVIALYVCIPPVLFMSADDTESYTWSQHFLWWLMLNVLCLLLLAVICVRMWAFGRVF